MNVINAIMGYESMFLVECVEDSIIYKISADDLRILTDQIELFDELKEIDSKFKFTGSKYDYTVFTNKWKVSKPNTHRSSKWGKSEEDKSSEKDSASVGFTRKSTWALS